MPVNIHSAQWMWINRHVYEDAGLHAAEELGRGRRGRARAAAPRASCRSRWRRAGRSARCPTTSRSACSASRTSIKIYKDKDVDARRAVRRCRRSSRRSTRPASWSIRRTIVPQWNDAVSLVITGKAGANVMGDWAQGEFQVADRSPARTTTACRPRHQPDRQHRRRRVLLPEEQRSGGHGGPAQAGVDHDLGAGAGRLQPEEGLAADPSGRRPRTLPTTA